MEYGNTEIVLVCNGEGFENLTLPEKLKTLAKPNLGYLPSLPGKNELQALVENLIQFFESIASRNDIIHFHNIGLGKNVAVTFAMFQLAKAGYKIVNHAHDFPEDRPANYTYLQEGLKLLTSTGYENILYPSFSNFRFGVLNSFDQKRLLKLGVKKSRVEVWPNPVIQPNLTSGATKAEAKLQLEKDLKLPQGKRIIAYPVRVIRRKNIGEYILLAALFNEQAHWLVTLPPQNPVEIEVYQKWVEFCQKEEIPITFEAGLKTSFETLMKGADVCFTTSVMEGFGMVFVEPWLWDTPVAGREISAVLPDLEQLGIRFPFIYKKLLVQWEEQLIDFPSLDITQQMACIKYYFAGRKEMFLQQNPNFLSFFSEDLCQSIQHNKFIITNDLSERKYGKQLYQFYTALSS